MADSEDQLNLKKRARRRLVGAIALITFVVIVLPMVFDKEAKPLPSDISVQIPSPDSSAIPHKVVPVPPAVVPVSPGVTPPAAPQATAPAVISPTVPVPVAASPTPAPTSAPSAIPAPAPLVSAHAKSTAAGKAVPPSAKAPAAVASAPAPAAAKSEAPAKPDVAHGHWGVKLGTFADAANVKRLQAKATEAKFKSYTEALDTPDGPRTRLWAGPFDTKAQAEHARDRLKKMGVAGLVAEQ